MLTSASSTRPRRPRPEALIDRELMLAREESNERARSGLLSFTRKMFPGFRVNWHHRLICRVLNRFAQGLEKRVIICAPPRHTKSELLSRQLPAFLLGRNPDERIIAASHTATLAADFNRDVQRIIVSRAYRDVFPKTRIGERSVQSDVQGRYLRNSEMFEIVDARGYYKCAGIGGALTGRGGDKLLLDDFLKDAKEAASRTVRDAQWDWYRAVFRTRLQSGGAIAATVTRWSHDDIIGRLLRLADSDPLADKWLVINLPAVNEVGPAEYDERQIGEALWPSEYSLRDLEQTRVALGSRIFGALYQQRPTQEKGDIVQTDWWRTYRKASVPAFDLKVISADLTFKDSEKGDFNAIGVWGRAGADKYLVHCVHRRMGFTQQLACIRQLVHDNPDVSAIYVEESANGAALIDTLKKEIAGIIAVPARSSKVARAEAVAPQIEAGNVYLPDPDEAAWVRTFLQEWAEFPSGAHDDYVDMTTQALDRLGRRSGFDFEPISFEKDSAWL